MQMSKIRNSKQKNSRRLFFHFAAAILVLVSCARQVKQPVRVCVGEKSAAEVLSILRLHSENTMPLRANGQCLLQFYAEGKRHKENFPMKLWVNPPVEVCLQGDVAFDPRGIVLGSNEREFWLSIRPKEVSTYQWGQWSEECHFKKLMISPKTLLEALGIAAVGSDESSEENWFLSGEDDFDVLTKRNEQGAIIKKIYIYSGDYLVGRIEYFGAGGEIVIATGLDKYKEVSEDFFVPTIVKIVKRAEDGKEDLVSITLSLRSIKSANFNEKQRNRLFTRPEPRGFKHIYKIGGGNMIEQSQGSRGTKSKIKMQK